MAFTGGFFRSESINVIFFKRFEFNKFIMYFFVEKSRLCDSIVYANEEQAVREC